MRFAIEERAIGIELPNNNTVLVVFMADHTKLGRKASFFFAETTALSCLVTDKEADAAFVSELRGKGVEVLIGD